jgi:hypothetical protein
VFDRWVVPQLVLIDRKGVIRRQSGLQGDPQLQDARYLKTQIESMLQEGAAAVKRPPAKKRPS